MAIVSFLCYYILDIIFCFLYQTYDINSIYYDTNESLNGKFIYSFRPNESCLENEEPIVLGLWKIAHQNIIMDNAMKNKKKTKLSKH